MSTVAWSAWRSVGQTATKSRSSRTSWRIREAYAAAMGHFIEWHTDNPEAWPVVNGGKPLFKRFYKHPTILYMRLVPEVAVAVYAMKLQHDGKPVPPAVLGVYGKMKAFG